MAKQPLPDFYCSGQLPVPARRTTIVLLCQSQPIYLVLRMSL
jgi:hypothetical protein